MIEAFKQVFFCLFWFTADCVLIFMWILFISAIISSIEKKGKEND